MPKVSYEYRKAYYEERITWYKNYLGGKCVKCGSIENLQFDHRFPKDKSFTITAKYDAKWEIMKPELDKCQLLCLGCHIVKGQTQGDVKAAVTHGSLGMYSHCKCRCLLCKDAWNKHSAEYRRNKRKQKSSPVILSGKGPSL